MAKFDLRAEARSFADELSSLLNATICDGVRLNAVVTSVAGAPMAIVGYNIRTDRWLTCEGIPIALGKRAPRAHIGIQFRLRPDGAEKHLAVQSSVFALALDRDLNDELFHVDFERDKSDGYPDAHLQIVASSDHWETWCGAIGTKGREIGRLHFPVGGNRFRPSLEDLIEFLIREDLAEGRDGWEVKVAEGRSRFHERQLRAAVWSAPEFVREVLAEVDRANQ